LLRIGWFSTGRDRDALTLFSKVHKAIQEGFLEDVEISFVYCNREPGEFPESDEFMAYVKKCNVPLIYLSHRKFMPKLRERGLEESKRGVGSQALEKWREMYDRRLEKLIQNYSVDLNMLAGYMLILSEYFTRRHVMINLHPAPPGGPKGTWQEVIWETIKRRLSEAGCMMHVVTENLDEGPPATYCTFPLRGPKFDGLWREVDEKLESLSFEELKAAEGEENPLFKAIRREEFKRETPLIIETLKAMSQRRIRIDDGTRMVLVDGKASKRGLCLNREVEKHLGSEA